MASSQAPATPSSQLSAKASSSTPGNWSHPRMREIAMRRKAATFDDENFSSVVSSSIALIATFLLPHYVPFEVILQAVFSSVVTSTAISIGTYILWILRVGLMLQGCRALMPLWNKDDLSDIALTPSQRNLLGLPPTPKTPAEGDVQTPPRYRRSTGGSSRIATAGSSPFTRSVSGSAIPGSAGSSVASFGSVGSGASPLMRHAIKTGSGKRWSLGTSGGFDESVFGNGGPSLPASPSPLGGTGGQRAVSVGLNSKWLYKRQHGGSPSGFGKYI